MTSPLAVLIDLIPYTQVTYLRLFERYNVALWPAALVGLAMGLVVLITVARPTLARYRLSLLLLMAAWLWTGLVFLVGWYGELNWFGVYAGLVFAGQGLMMGWLLWRPPPRPPDAVGGAIALVAFAVLFWPLLGRLDGRSWLGLELFGSSPDPTVVATLGFLLIAPHRLRWLLAIVPLSWCLISGMTQFLFGLLLGILLPLAAVLYLALLVWSRSSARPE